MDVMMSVVSQPIPNFSTMQGNFPIHIYQIMHKMMRKKPEDRYQNAGELLVDLRRGKSSSMQHAINTKRPATKPMVPQIRKSPTRVVYVKSSKSFKYILISLIAFALGFLIAWDLYS